jgi:hypothetical protein
MLDWKIAKGLPVQYPPGGDERTNQSHPNMKEYWEAFRWFAHESQRDFLRRPRHMLKTPQEIKNGERQDGLFCLIPEPSTPSQGTPQRRVRQNDRKGIRGSKG